MSSAYRILFDVGYLKERATYSRRPRLVGAVAGVGRMGFLGDMQLVMAWLICDGIGDVGLAAV